jgi:hypothetical protein
VFPVRYELDSHINKYTRHSGVRRVYVDVFRSVDRFIVI